MSLRALPVLGLFVALVIVVIAGDAAYIIEMYDSTLSKESLVEATSFSMQTLTTVGYGNWEAPALGQPPLKDIRHRILWMRFWSIILMGVGALGFALFVSAVFSAVVPPTPKNVQNKPPSN